MSQNDSAHLALAGHIYACILSGLAGEKVSAPQWGRIGGRFSQVALLRPGTRMEFMQSVREDPWAAH